MVDRIKESEPYLINKFNRENQIAQQVKFDESSHSYYKPGGAQIAASVTKLVSVIKPRFEDTEIEHASNSITKQLIEAKESFDAGKQQYVADPQIAPEQVIDQSIIYDLGVFSFLHYLLVNTQVGTPNENDLVQIYAFMLGATIYTNLSSDKIMLHRKVLKGDDPIHKKPPAYPKPKETYEVINEYTFYGFNSEELPDWTNNASNKTTINKTTRIQLAEKKPRTMPSGYTITKGVFEKNALPDKKTIQSFVKLHWKEAGYQGSLVHDRMEYYINEYARMYPTTISKIPLRVDKYTKIEVLRLFEWYSNHMFMNKRVALLTEYRMYMPAFLHEHPEFAGSLDFLATGYRDTDSLYIYDWKRAKNVLKVKSPQSYYHKCVPASRFGNSNANLSVTYDKCERNHKCIKQCTNPEEFKSFGQTDLEFYMIQLNLYKRMVEYFFENKIKNKKAKVKSLNVVVVSPISYEVRSYELLCATNAQIIGFEEDRFTWDVVDERTTALLYICRNGIPEKKEKKKKDG